MKKLIFIGPYAKWQPPTNGQVAKNQTLLRRFCEIYDKVYSIDTSSWKENPFILVKMVIVLLFFRKTNVVIALCDNSAYNLLKFLYYVRRKVSVMYFVIGGGLSDKLEQGKYKLMYYRDTTAIIVEGVKMEVSMRKLGLKNVFYWPNARYIPKILLKNREYSHPLKFVFMSRIEPSKGCMILLEAVEILNKLGYSNLFSVQFWGTIDDLFLNEFKSKLLVLCNVSYEGFLDLSKVENYQILNNYDVMVFPSFYENEGFPGVLIDASICGLPVIASDWHLNKFIIVNGVNGYIVPIKDSQSLANSMFNFINNPQIIRFFSENSKARVELYDIEQILTKERLINLGMY